MVRTFLWIVVVFAPLAQGSAEILDVSGEWEVTNRHFGVIFSEDPTAAGPTAPYSISKTSEELQTNLSLEWSRGGSDFDGRFVSRSPQGSFSESLYCLRDIPSSQQAPALECEGKRKKLDFKLEFPSSTSARLTVVTSKDDRVLGTHHRPEVDRLYVPFVGEEFLTAMGTNHYVHNLTLPVTRDRDAFVSRTGWVKIWRLKKVVR
jgi:hypothetical protein